MNQLRPPPTHPEVNQDLDVFGRDLNMEKSHGTRIFNPFPPKKATKHHFHQFLHIPTQPQTDPKTDHPKKRPSLPPWLLPSWCARALKLMLKTHGAQISFLWNVPSIFLKNHEKTSMCFFFYLNLFMQHSWK